MLRRAVVWIAKVALLALAVDGIFGLFAVISIHRGNPYRLYYPHRLAAEVEANLPTEADAPATGWPAKGTKLTRDRPPLPRECGSAWGGSFTLSQELPEESAWPYVASVALGCDIANYGVAGYAMDQTYLLYQEHAPPKSLIVLGVSMPMITTSAVSSWTFIDPEDGLPTARLTKPFFTLKENQLVLHPRPAPTTKAIIDYYKSDGTATPWTPLSFPFSLSVIDAFQMKTRAPETIHEGPMSEGFKRYRAVTTAIIAAMAKESIARGDQFVLLMIPPPIYEGDDFSNMLRASVDGIPGVCFVDPTDEIAKARSALPDPAALATASGHFSTVGDAAIARALVKGLADCGIHP